MRRGAVAVRTLAAGVPDAPLVALVHGLEDSWRSWRPLAAHLDSGWRVAGLDMPWRAGNDYGWRYEESSAGWLARGFDTLAAEPDVVVAHSYAANAMLELAARGRAPAAVTVLVCPLYWSKRSTVTWTIFDRSRRAFDGHIRESIRARLGRRAAGAGPDVVDAMTEVTVRRVGPSGFLAAFDQFVASGWLDLTRVGQPTLIVAGIEDPSLPKGAAAAMAGRLRRGSVRIDASYDHFCHVRQAAMVAADISAFVASVDQTPAGATTAAATRKAAQ